MGHQGKGKDATEETTNGWNVFTVKTAAGL